MVRRPARGGARGEGTTQFGTDFITSDDGEAAVELKMKYCGPDLKIVALHVSESVQNCRSSCFRICVEHKQVDR